MPLVISKQRYGANLVNQIEIQPCRRAIHADVLPPGSKSLTNRALPCAALAKGNSFLTGILDSEDTRVMVDCLTKLGIKITPDWENHTIEIEGCDGCLPANKADLFVENSGTTIRFLTALCAIGSGEYRLDGIPRMQQRPMGDLIDALNSTGVEIVSENENGCPPIRLQANGIPGGSISIRGDISSQFLSAILMAAPYAQEQIEISVAGELVSKPYIAMTVEVMKYFGCAVRQHPADNSFSIPNHASYRATRYAIEPDASAASYFWAAAAITEGNVLVKGLNRDALQGDVRFINELAKMGCQIWESDHGIAIQGDRLHGIETNMNEISDTVQTLAAVALFAEGPTTIRGVAHNRHKETDRISDLACELRKFGATVEEFDDGLKITPGELRSAEIETYNDHRMAMSMALVGLKQPGVIIKDPDCTRKTFPDYFDRLNELIASG